MTGEEGTDCPMAVSTVRGEAGLLPHMERPRLLAAGHLCPAGTACEVQGPGRVPHNALGPRGRSLWGP